MSSTSRRAAGRDWLRAATARRMIVLLVAVALLVTVFVQLGIWQYDRSGIRGEESAAIEREELLAAAAVPVEDVLAPQTAFDTEHFGRRVSLQGSFDPEQQLLVPDRGIDGEAAVLVVTAFHVAGGPHDGAIMPVLRGWLPEAAVLADRLEAGDAPQVALAAPPPSPGETTIVGMLSDSEAADPRDLPPGLVGGISTAQLVNVWGTPMYGGYLVLETPDQPSGLRPAPSPVEQLDADPNLQSLMYAVEWWAFALFAVAFWLKVLRDDVRDLRRSRVAAAATVGTAPVG
ncbi:SURF1 family protein [Georgenia sp. MJ173]|uniref:SURF1 family protein n=1 Tax=Georgenia sunbinii TaxID=3117728 RepID=UPI002F260EA4